MKLLNFPWRELIWPTNDSKGTAIKLFLSSLFLVNNYFDKKANYFGDCITRFLHGILPLSWQNAFREAGGIAKLMDVSALFIGIGLISANPQAILDMMHISQGTTRLPPTDTYWKYSHL